MASTNQIRFHSAIVTVPWGSRCSRGRDRLYLALDAACTAILVWGSKNAADKSGG
jgi:hypothetical protein